MATPDVDVAIPFGNARDECTRKDSASLQPQIPAQHHHPDMHRSARTIERRNVQHALVREGASVDGSEREASGKKRRK